MATPPPNGDGVQNRRATMADVADRAGVSRTLVSLIFSDKPGASEATRERVLRAADELDYHLDSAARLLARGRSRTLGVLVDVQQPFQSEMIGPVYDAAEGVGYEILLSASSPTRNEHKAIEALLSHRCEGLILLSPLSESTYLRALGDRAVVTIVGRRVRGAEINSVRSADDTGIRQSVDHLVGLGHRDIVHVDGGRDSVSSDRRSAYVASMRHHGLGKNVHVIAGAHDESAGAGAARTLLAQAMLPTAVLAGNDRSAIGLMDGLSAAGISVPDEVSVVGYDDTPLSRLSRIDLTTVRQDSGALARNAVQYTVERLEDVGLLPTESIIEPQLIVRSTTSPACR